MSLADQKNLKRLSELREYKLKKLQVELNINNSKLAVTQMELEDLITATERYHDNRIKSQKAQFIALQSNTISSSALSMYRNSLKEMKKNEESLLQQIEKKKTNIVRDKKNINSQKELLKDLNKKIEGLKMFDFNGM